MPLFIHIIGSGYMFCTKRGENSACTSKVRTLDRVRMSRTASELPIVAGFWASLWERREVLEAKKEEGNKPLNTMEPKQFFCLPFLIYQNLSESDSLSWSDRETFTACGLPLLVNSPIFCHQGCSLCGSSQWESSKIFPSMPWPDHLCWYTKQTVMIVASVFLPF